MCVQERTGWINRFSPWLHSRPTTASFSVQPFNPVASLQAVNGARLHLVRTARALLEAEQKTPATSHFPPPAPLLACRAVRPPPPLIPKIKFKKIPSSLPPVFPFARRPPKNHERLRGTRRRTRGGRAEQNRTAAEEAPHHVA